MRDSFAAIERRERFGDAGDLPLVDIEVGDDGFGRQERAGSDRLSWRVFEAALLLRDLIGMKRCRCSYVNSVARDRVWRM